ncbi:MAG: metallophosphoesterase family protein [Anaerolineae bacterium]|nr:metallophosphoesterase family protein [Anaerolineae bacterium]
MEIEAFSNSEEIVVGVVSDTHVPDLANGLHPQLIPALKQENVQLIFHAGDICTPSVICSLEEVAPVIAVRGNRDFLFLDQLPLVRQVELCGQRIVVMHGHRGWYTYLRDKFQNYIEGYRLDRYVPRLGEPFPEAAVIVFGHTHFAVSFLHGTQLFFNPGSAICKAGLKQRPSFGVLSISKQGVKGKHIILEKAALRHRQWVTIF